MSFCEEGFGKYSLEKFLEKDLSDPSSLFWSSLFLILEKLGFEIYGLEKFLEKDLLDISSLFWHSLFLILEKLGFEMYDLEQFLEKNLLDLSSWKEDFCIGNLLNFEVSVCGLCRLSEEEKDFILGY